MRLVWARCRVQTRNQRGVALFAAIAGMVLLSTMIAALVILARNENMIAQLNKDEAQAAYAAEAGANWGRRRLHTILHTDLPARVVVTPRATLAAQLQSTYRTSVGAAQFIRDYAIPASGPSFAACSPCQDPTYSVVFSNAATKQIDDDLQNVLTLTCPGTAGCPANMSFTSRIIVSAHPTIAPVINGVTSNDVGAVFTYVWRIESSGTAGRARQQYVIHDSSVPTHQAGSFTIALSAEFVRYAHFIDQFQDAGSGDPWVSWRHIYTGPVHTNRRFSILGGNDNIGPTFRSETTQTMTTTRFSNGGSEQNLSRDSSSRDWPKLGAYPGIVCQLTDCSGFTRGFDFDPTTPGTIDPVPFPATGTLGTADDARKQEICVALGVTGGARPACPNTVTTATMPTPSGNCATVPVVVDNQCALASGMNLLGGVYVNGSLLPTNASGVRYVTDLQLSHTSDGQTIVIYTYSPCANCSNPNRRVIIEEKRSTNEVLVTRQCLKTGASPSDTSSCTTSAGGTWWLDVSSTANNGAINRQTFTGVFSRYPGDNITPAVTDPFDYGVLYVYNADIGQVNTSNGLRRGTFNVTSCTPRTTGNGGTEDCHTTGWVDPSYAIFQDTTRPQNGTRLTVAADGNVWITGHLNYRVEPRGPDGEFSDPTPGDPSGSSADDELDVQNVLGVVSWATPSAWVPTTLSGGIRLSSALTGNLDIHGMIFVANLSNRSEPSGQFSFDDPSGSYRGVSQVIGGVVQKTMGTFGQPSANTGYERDWVYDERFRYRALSPPAFPGFPNFTAGTSLGIDSYTWRLGLF